MKKARGARHGGKDSRSVVTITPEISLVIDDGAPIRLRTAPSDIQHLRRGIDARDLGASARQRQRASAGTGAHVQDGAARRGAKLALPVAEGRYKAYGGGIRSLGALTVNGSTIRDNVANVAYTGGIGGGIYHDSGALTITNSTLSGNSADYGGGGISNYTLLGSPLLDYNDVWNNTGDNYYNVTPGVHDISADPLLVDPANGDFHLSAGSPGIDTGDPVNYPPTDFEGDPRPLGGGYDLGYDEFALHTLLPLVAK